MLMTSGALLAASALLVSCTSNEPEASDNNTKAAGNNGSSNDDPGDKVVIGFSGPQADHGWLAAVNSSAKAEAEKYSDIDFKQAEGTNDANLQISQIETFINDKVDAIVLLPTDGAALTDVAIRAMEAGIPVINVDREFSSPFAARATVLGDNYGMGVSAGTYACQVKKDKNLSNPVIAEIAGIDALPLTQDRSKGFADALKVCGEKVDNRVAAAFTVESGEKEASNLLQAAPKIDIIWNHDDDQGVGVKAAFDNANRNEFAFIGGAGSCNAMGWIEDGSMASTVIYPPTQAADGIRLARLVAQNKGMSDLVQVEVPRRIVLNAPVVTKDNVADYKSLCFES
jgi:ribose transport system substrate-binding protein